MMIAKPSRRHDRAVCRQLRVEGGRIAYGRNCENRLAAQCIDGRSQSAIRLSKIGGVEVSHGARHPGRSAHCLGNEICPVERHRFPCYDHDRCATRRG
jgi:hypothetical protein